MPRPCKCRKISSPPLMQGFKPFGITSVPVTSVNMSLEEFESFRLVNYQKKSQDEAAVMMQVSRPTFTRIYNRALSHIAVAFAEGRQLLIEGGNFQLENDWYRCRKCCRLIQGKSNHFPCAACECYNDEELVPINK